MKNLTSFSIKKLTSFLSFSIKKLTSLSKETKLFLALFAALLLPYLLYGFRYFPVLDDYLQYWCYPAHHDFSHIYLTIGTLSTRPLASLLDVAFWGQLWPVMGLSLFLITVMHFFSAVFFVKTLKRFEVSLSPLFLLIYLLMPLGMEGRYWLSASTRIVCGMFFASLSLWFLGRYLKESQSLKFLLPFALIQLISCGFYESTAVFSVTAAVLLFVLSYKESRNKSLFWVPGISLVNILLMFLYYQIFAGLGMSSSRVAGMSLWSVPANLLEILRQLCEALALLYEGIVIGGFEGIKVLWTNGFWGILLFFLMLALSVVISLFTGARERKNKNKSLFLVGGLILFLMPLAPNALTSDVWITNRSLYASILGIALILEPGFCREKNRLTRATALCTVAFLFMTATVNEYDIYRRTNELDNKLLDQVISQMDEDALAGNRAVCVSLPEEVVVPQNAFYKDHVKSVFDSDWALLGALRTKAKTLDIQYAQPLLPEQEMTYEGSQIIEITDLADEELTE